jgi:ATP synthase F1 complex assembly factor 1
MLRTTLTRLPRARVAAVPARSFAASSAPRDIIKKLEESLTPREAVERKRKEFEAKYGDKLKQKVES